ncbi:MAG: protein translocase subunit SecD [Myxococcales bacterium]|nr:protein translocase subunit SecD [Myxococcales bacterium]
MERKVKWRTFWLVALIGLSVMTLVPSFVARDQLPSWFSGLFNSRINYGLDLQGGLHIVYSIDLDKAVDDKASELKRDVEAQLEELGIKGRVSTPAAPVGAVSVILDDAKDVEQIRSRVARDYDEIVAMRDCSDGPVKAQSVCFRVSSDYAEGIKSSALEQAIQTVRERINERGVADPSVIAKGDQIIVELPGLDEEEIGRVKDLIERTAKLEFKIVDEAEVNGKVRNDFMKRVYGFAKTDQEALDLEITVDIDQWPHDDSGRRYDDYYLRAEDKPRMFLKHAEADEMGCPDDDEDRDPKGRRCYVTGRQVLLGYLEGLAARNPELGLDDDHTYGYELVKPSSAKNDPYWRSYYLYRTVELAGSAVQNSYVYWNPTSNKPEVLIEFNRWGGRRFGELTGKSVGRKMAIILDDKISSAPTIQARIAGGSSSISMAGNNPQQMQKEAQDLVNVLRTGSLPAPLRADSESKVGPLLGADAVNKAKFAFILGSLLVVFIMVGYYRTCGVISIVALALNILFMMAILATFGATLTLPGIAALVLTVGMAVDANIIIYERIREELRSGKSVKGAVDAGFGRGFAAILDGQLTTGIAGYVLYQFGSGPIRGFAVMLMIGIVCTLFSATWVTRLFFEHYVGKGRKAPTISL